MCVMSNYFKSISDFNIKCLNILFCFEFIVYTQSHIHIFMCVYAHKYTREQPHGLTHTSQVLYHQVTSISQ